MTTPTPSSRVDAYLATLGRSLWLRPRVRREVLEELRPHLEAVDAEAGPAPDALVTAFGDPVLLARRIQAERPWWQTAAPLRPTIALFAACVAWVLVRLVQADETVALVTSWGLAAATALAAAAVARRGVHPLHVLLTGLRPTLLVVGVLVGLGMLDGTGLMVLPVAASALLIAGGLVIGPMLLASDRCGSVRLGLAIFAAPLAYIANVLLNLDFLVVDLRSNLHLSHSDDAELALLTAFAYYMIGYAAACWARRGRSADGITQTVAMA